MSLTFLLVFPRPIVCLTFGHLRTWLFYSTQVITESITDEFDIREVDVHTYVRKCVSLCWTMRLQDPPVHIGVESVSADDSFDTSKFKAYTKSGKLLDYIVWPPLYLHEGGSMLGKGVAQGKNEYKSI